MALAAGESSAAAALDRVGGALWGLFIGDALAAPTHWYYGGQGQVLRDYGGPIKGYTKPKEMLSGSIMNLSNTGGGGRGSDAGEIIGKVINHDKKKYWTRGGSYHYHCTLAKGENTLEAQLTRLVCRSITENGGRFVADDLRQRYIEFMTTPGTHNDCYASTCHRMFFANLSRGLPPEKCPDNDNHNVDTIDGLIMGVPVVLATYGRPTVEAKRDVSSCLAVTRNSNVLPGYADGLTEMFREVIEGKPLPKVLANSAGERFLQGIKNKSDPVVA
jgi:ADP-ribosylglycohydrolase